MKWLVQHRRQRTIITTSWRHMTTTFCPDLTLHSPSPRRFYAALTLSAGEYQVSEGESKGEFKVSRPGGICLIF